MHNILAYKKNFDTLNKITSTSKEKISFSKYVYDPTHRKLYYNDNEIVKFTKKEGSIIEILAINYRNIVKKEIILEKVWHKNDYFVGRSMDVYITYLRNIFKEHNIDLNIINVSGSGLMIE